MQALPSGAQSEPQREEVCAQGCEVAAPSISPSPRDLPRGMRAAAPWGTTKPLQTHVGPRTWAGQQHCQLPECPALVLQENPQEVGWTPVSLLLPGLSCPWLVSAPTEGCELSLGKSGLRRSSWMSQWRARCG